MNVTQFQNNSNTSVSATSAQITLQDLDQLDNLEDQLRSVCDLAFESIQALWEKYKNLGMKIPPALRILAKTFRAGAENSYEKLSTDPYYPITEKEVINLKDLPKSAILIYLLALSRAPFADQKLELTNSDLYSTLGLSRWSGRRATEHLNQTLLHETPLNPGERRGRKSKKNPDPKANLTLVKSQPEKRAISPPALAYKDPKEWTEMEGELLPSDGNWGSEFVAELHETESEMVAEPQPTASELLQSCTQLLQECTNPSTEPLLCGASESSQLDLLTRSDLNKINIQINESDPKEEVLEDSIEHPEWSLYRPRAGASSEEWERWKEWSLYQPEPDMSDFANIPREFTRKYEEEIFGPLVYPKIKENIEAIGLEILPLPLEVRALAKKQGIMVTFRATTYLAAEFEAGRVPPDIKTVTDLFEQALINFWGADIEVPITDIYTIWHDLGEDVIFDGDDIPYENDRAWLKCYTRDGTRTMVYTDAMEYFPLEELSSHGAHEVLRLELAGLR